MFRTGLLFVSLSLLALPGLVRADDPDGDQPAPKKGVWFPWLNRGGSQPAHGKDAKTEKADGAEKRAAALKAQASARAREKENWLRRVNVCDRLKEIALMTNDAELLRKAEQLDQRAWTMYQERANLPLSSAGMIADERLLDQRLETTAGLRPSTSPASATTGVQAALQGGRP